ncbi:piggyBac transposable element-derived 4-like protein [Labeo rohita]|uniref:PiggyBac transposable element-derived 4-like protein n=1 Tax=Labeo rohita TaxID=84645 RepID=A0A498L3I9_LABRO|nr:piggyBac transposable element-derived 4-like protein [Labeo rohita]
MNNFSRLTCCNHTDGCCKSNLQLSDPLLRELDLSINNLQESEENGPQCQLKKLRLAIFKLLDKSIEDFSLASQPSNYQQRKPYNNNIQYSGMELLSAGLMSPYCKLQILRCRYNTFMGGVDTADQRMKTYLFPHRSRKWYNCIFNAILSICVVNSHIIYSKCAPGPHKPLKAFIQDIITALLEGYSKRESKKPERPSVEGGRECHRGSLSATGSALLMIGQIAAFVLIAHALRAVGRQSTGAVSVG